MQYKHVCVGAFLCNSTIFNTNYRLYAAQNMCKSRMHENFLHVSMKRSIKILRKKTKKLRTVNLCKNTYTCSAWVLVKFYICVRVCMREHVYKYVVVRFVCSFVFSVLSDDCWRPWQQLTWLMRRRIVALLKCVLVARRFGRQ